MSETINPIDVLSRRAMIQAAGGGLGSIGLAAALLADEQNIATVTPPPPPRTARPPRTIRCHT